MYLSKSGTRDWERVSGSWRHTVCTFYWHLTFHSVSLYSLFGFESTFIGLFFNVFTKIGDSDSEELLYNSSLASGNISSSDSEEMEVLLGDHEPYQNEPLASSDDLYSDRNDEHERIIHGDSYSEIFWKSISVLYTEWVIQKCSEKVYPY